MLHIRMLALFTVEQANKIVGYLFKELFINLESDCNVMFIAIELEETGVVWVLKVRPMLFNVRL